MYYDDEARQFNFASGFLLGVILGTGLALLARPSRDLGAKLSRHSGRRMKKGARQAGDRLHDRLVEPATEKLASWGTAVRRAARTG